MKEIEKYLMEEKYFNNIEMYKNEIFELIPELRDTDGFDHKHPHHSYDVWEHTLVALRSSKPDLQIRLALLLHDIGKPHSYQEGEVRHFHGHPEKSAEMSEKILQRLGYSQKELNNICYLVREHDTIIEVNEINKYNMDLIRKRLHIQYCDAYAHNPKYVQKRIDKLDEIKKQVEERIKQINQGELSQVGQMSQTETSPVGQERE